MPSIPGREVCACPLPAPPLILRSADKTTSVWKPLRGPLRDWPLALCDMSSVLATDVLAADIVYSNRVVENFQVHHAETQAWYYLQDHQPSELLIFQQADSSRAGISGTSDVIVG